MTHSESIENIDQLTQRRALLAGLGGLAAGAFVAGKAKAGPLDPPAGPIASTGKTLTEVEPRIAINQTNTPGDAGNIFRIMQPGSYYLTGNVAGESGKNGIRVEAPGVTLDLNGFELRGVPGSLRGIDMLSSPHSTVRNGRVIAWGGRGLSLQGEYITVESVGVSDCGSVGIRVSDTGSCVRDSYASNNLGIGISVGVGSTITNCVARGNAEEGIFCTSDSVIGNCVSELNGIHGIYAFQNTLIRDCLATNNAIRGIYVVERSTIVRCRVERNDASGIVAGADCVVRENDCFANGASGSLDAGIWNAGRNTLIEGNSCISTNRGIRVTSSGSLIIRNTCASNATNYDILANNRYGSIVNITATGAAAVSGSSAPSTLTSTDPWANFAY